MSRSHPEQWTINERAGGHRVDQAGRHPGAINMAVQCGGVAVRPGDVVRADSSGLVVVPRERLAEAVAAARVVAERETAWRAAILGGQSLPAATGIDDLLATGGRRRSRRPRS